MAVQHFGEERSQGSSLGEGHHARFELIDEAVNILFLLSCPFSLTKRGLILLPEGIKLIEVKVSITVITLSSGP